VEYAEGNLQLDSSEISELEQVVLELLQLGESGAQIETAPEKLRFSGALSRAKDVCRGLILPRRDAGPAHLTGDVQDCSEYPSVGNISLQSAKEIWEGAKAREIRA
jgi:hypothetical protein